MRPNACRNYTARADGYYVLTRQYVPSGEYHLEPEWIEDVMSKACRSDIDIQRTGPCAGCDREQDFEYLKQQGLV